MQDFIVKKQSNWLSEDVETYARTGLRTLVIAQKVLSLKDYGEWRKRYDTACNAMRSREEKIRKVIDLLEQKMELLALTGVEDKLQDDVQQTLYSLRQAEIKIWMLTGDKVETAICIAVSTSLKKKDEQCFVLDTTLLQTSLLPRKNSTFLQIASKIVSALCAQMGENQRYLLSLCSKGAEISFICFPCAQKGRKAALSAFPCAIRAIPIPTALDSSPTLLLICPGPWL